MRNLLSTIAALGVALVLTASGTKVLAQQARMAVAAHKGTFNYLRTAPDNHSHILEKMRQGTQLEVVGMQGDYYAVVLADGTHGWTYRTNVRFGAMSR